MEKMNMSAPWVLYYRKIEALFGKDPEISVVFDDENNIIRLYVDNQEKAEAIDKLLPDEKTFGNVTISTVVIPANKVAESKASIFQTAFAGNPAFAYTQVVDGVFSNPISYVVFKNEVVQYFADNMHDIHGYESTLYQDIAKEVFGEEGGICFCTDLPWQKGEKKDEV